MNRELDQNLSPEELEAVLSVARKIQDQLNKIDVIILGKNMWCYSLSDDSIFCFICNAEVKLNDNIHFNAADHGRSHIKHLKAFL